ncbi:MAG TPA: TolC family protein [Burkholderiaceae bacterium]|nr:TolC family protein [Burkholderiaceae bacterium]
MRSSLSNRISGISGAGVLVLGLAGCTTFSADGGFGSVESSARSQLGKDVVWSRTDADSATVAARVAELLAKPLSVDDAVQIALINNKGLQAGYYELGLSESDLVYAGRLPNPGFVFARKTQGDEVEIERLFTLNLMRLLTIPLAVEIESRRFEQTQQRVTLEVLTLASVTRKAYFEAVAAEESVRYTRRAMESAEAGAELARRMAQAGNWGKLQQAREQSFYADSALSLARAEQARIASRERLIRQMGLWGGQTAFELPERLPDLPKQADELPNIEQQAMAQRLDVQSARRGTEAVAANLGLTKATRFINVLEFGVIHNSFNNAPVQRGYEIAIEVPLFDWGNARVAQAEAIYGQAVNRLAETAVNARSEVRQAYLNYRASYDIARHYRDEIVPIRKRISEENVLRYNGMLIGVFELLADARSQIASVNGYIEALRDFWLSKADLEMSLIGRPDARNAPTAARGMAPAEAGH